MYRLSISTLQRACLLTAVLLIFCCESHAQRQEFTPEERAEITRMGQCEGACIDPVKRMFQKVEDGAGEVLTPHMAFDIGVGLITQSTVVTILADVAAHVIDHLVEGLPPVSPTPRPSDRTITVTTSTQCFDSHGNTVKCP